MPPKQWIVLALIPLAYLVGSIPFGLLIGRARGIDPRTAGSGNIGATNVGRLLGKKYFAIVFTLDLLKGLIPVAAAGIILHSTPHATQDFLLWLLVGAAAIVGHMFSIFLKFQGGKGVATSAGVLLGVFPYYTIPGIIAIAIWIILFKATRYVSLASIFGVLAFPIMYVIVGLLAGWPIFHEQLTLLIFATLMALLIVYRHRGNIARLRDGTENRFAAKS
jgi:acyl phosphate:glycerol-3-phosphate acyltransferase